MKIEDYNEYYIQGSDHYLIPKDVFKELFNEMENWREEVKELKKQLEVGEEQYNDLVEEKEKLQEQLSCNTLQLEEYKHKSLYNTCLPYSTGYKKAIKEKENQQKEFIYWLEAMNRMYQNEYKDIDTAEHYNCVLQKYKSIIGDDK